MQKTPIKLINAALDDSAETGDVVLRGTVALDSLGHLKVDDYQREEQAPSTNWRIKHALETGDRLPDLDLGMRGESFTQHKDGSVSLHNPVYIIDGLQRVATILRFLETDADAKISIGATVHLNTKRTWERERFHNLNAGRLKISPSVMLRNMRDDNPAILALYGLSQNDKDFPLNGRICWQQKMARGELITALSFAKVVGVLHSHKLSGRSSTWEDLASGLASGLDSVGIQALRANIKEFFKLVDAAWGIRRVQYKGGIHLKTVFLVTLADLISRHKDFWVQPDEKRLAIPAHLGRKIASFPVDDPEIMRLSGSSGKAKDILWVLMRDHINRGKRTKRLTPREAYEPSLDEDEDEVEAA